MRIPQILASLASLVAIVKAPAPFRSCHIVSGVTLTFFGIPDNDGNADITFNCGRGFTAGGIGTYNDPVTFASAPSEFEKCEIIFDPYLRKYLRHEDFCPECTVEWYTRRRHIKVWVGSNRVGGGMDQLDCQRRLTPTPGSQFVIRNPRQNLTVDATPLFVLGRNSSSCNVDHTYPSYNPRNYC